MRWTDALVLAVRVLATVLLLGAIVWFPETVNGLDLVLYLAVWVISGWWQRAIQNST